MNSKSLSFFRGVERNKITSFSNPNNWKTIRVDDKQNIIGTQYWIYNEKNVFVAILQSSGKLCVFIDDARIASDSGKKFNVNPKFLSSHQIKQNLHQAVRWAYLSTTKP